MLNVRHMMIVFAILGAIAVFCAYIPAEENDAAAIAEAAETLNQPPIAPIIHREEAR